MPFARPTLQQIAARVKLDVQGALAGTAAFFRLSFERAITYAMAGVSHGMHAHLAWIARQLDPNSADDDMVETVHGAPYGVNKVAAVATQLTLSATGTNGTIVPQDHIYLRADGARYKVDAQQTVSGGTVTFNVTAEIPGAAANTDVLTVFEVGSPIAGLASSATVQAVVVVGSDKETPEAYLNRVNARKQTPPKGGAEGDYEGWTREVGGVTRVWEMPKLEGPSTVTIYAVNDDANPITLLNAKLTEIADYIDSPGRQPTTATVYVRTPTLQQIPMTIAIYPNTPEVRTAVEAGLDDFYRREGHPKGMLLSISQLNEAISIAPGEQVHELASPVSDQALAVGTLPTRGPISWSTMQV